MRKYFALLTIFIIIFSFVNKTQAQSESVTDIKSDKIQKLIDSLANYYKISKHNPDGGFYLYIMTPSGNYMFSSGVNPPATQFSNLRVASITKTFTAAAIMMLHDQGKLNIYDEITDNFPGTNTPYVPNDSNYNIPYKNDITIKMLLGHRAGVFDVTNDAIPAGLPVPYSGKRYLEYIREQPNNDTHTFTFDELVGVVAKNQLSYFKPDADFHYSNTGYNILGKIIERASGMTYSDFINDHFFKPLVFSSVSVYKGDDMNIPNPKIEGYVFTGSESINATVDNMSGNVSEGNIIANPYNLATWMKLLISGKAGVSMNSVKLMEEMKDADARHGKYGLGLTITDGLGYGHDGAHAGYLNTLRYNPDTDISIFIASNFWEMSEGIDSMMKQGGSMTRLALDAIDILND
jgi:D-alanyl-D-alanine carboxypeptidase